LSFSSSFANGSTTIQVPSFRIQVDLNGKEQVLYTFHGIDGIAPQGPLIADADGNLYGTTLGGGHMQRFGCDFYGCGTVFKLTRH
jgi:hypothetical protein